MHRLMDKIAYFYIFVFQFAYFSSFYAITLCLYTNKQCTFCWIPNTTYNTSCPRLVVYRNNDVTMIFLAPKEGQYNIHLQRLLKYLHLLIQCTTSNTILYLQPTETYRRCDNDNADWFWVKKDMENFREISYIDKKPYPQNGICYKIDR